tara:strand:+ start:207 stop:518 length:312 start_codon:yes stop_codon:yes gene_type:complete
MVESIEDAVEQIYRLQGLYDGIEDPSKKIVMNRMFVKNIEGFITKMEESYYKKIIQRKTVTQLKNNQEKEMERTYNTMNAFLPFIIAYNMNTPLDNSTVDNWQ